MRVFDTQDYVLSVRAKTYFPFVKGWVENMLNVIYCRFHITDIIH